MFSKKHNLVVEENNALRSAIAPLGLDFSPISRFYMGDYICRIYSVIQYPTAQDYGWVSRINNIAGTIVSFSAEPLDNNLLVPQLSKIVNSALFEAEHNKDAIVRQRKQKLAEDASKVMQQIDQNNEAISHLCCNIMVMGNDEQDFYDKCNRVESVFAGIGCKIRAMSRIQKEAWKQMSPSYPPQELMTNIGNRPMPVSTFFGGFPFENSGFNDGKGYYLGVDNDGTPIIFDLWRKGFSRTNANITIIGGSGTGKTTLTQFIIVSELIRGTKVIIIDPETEYKALYEIFKPDGISKWIDACGGENGIINPLQIRPKPLSDEEEEENSVKGISELALHLKTLEIFFELYLPELSQIQKALLNKALIDMYNKFNIDWNTKIEYLNNEDFPVMTDLYNTLKESRLTADKGVIDDYDKLIVLLQNVAEGADKFLWNGKTTIKNDAQLIVFDTQNMRIMSDNMKQTQYFNLLSWCWQQMAMDRDEKVMIVCDEAWLLINPKVPQSMEYLRDTEKRARKYNGSLVVSTQNVLDFLGDTVKMYGQPVLDLPSTKFIFGCTGGDLAAVKELYSLTEAQQELVAAKNRGECLMQAGTRSLKLKVQIPEKRLAQLGDGRGK
ncbi:MAG: DUF87 domain-containing protein [Ruminiclostridium sp.]|nr:DUF87 domain-containing protein [Ruminiclostridium sp.]